MSFDRRIPLPTLDNLPFIDSEFLIVRMSGLSQPAGVDEQPWPDMVDESFLASLNLLSRQTAIDLFSAIKPSFHGATVRSLEDLQVLAGDLTTNYRTRAAYEGRPRDFTEGHMQAYILTLAEYSKEIDWRRVATLFNRSSEDQRDALDAFFWEFKRIDLQDLMRKKGPDLKLPDGLRTNKSRTGLDGREIYCEIANKWLVDDAFSRQFRVIFRDAISCACTEVGSGGTIEMAIAKATAFAIMREKRYPACTSGTLGSILVRYKGDLVANANLLRSLEMDVDDDRQPSPSNTGGLIWNEPPSSVMPKERFRKSLRKVEKMFDITWSKVRHLEEDLGM
jgi:hypothetical protein